MKLESTIDHWNFRRLDEKKLFLDTFSIENWRELTLDKKRKHTFTSCKGCYKEYSSILSFFPVKSNYLKNRLPPTPLVVAQKSLGSNIEAAKFVNHFSSELGHTSNSATAKQSVRKAVSDAKILFDKTNDLFQKIHTISLSTALSKASGIDLQKSVPTTIKQKQRRQNFRENKAKLQKRWKENDADSFLHSRISYSKRQTQRMTQFFETKGEALDRSKKRKNQERLGILKKKRHSPKPEDIEFDSDQLLSEVTDLQEGDKVIFAFLKYFGRSQPLQLPLAYSFIYLC